MKVQVSSRFNYPLKCRHERNFEEDCCYDLKAGWKFHGEETLDG